MFSVDLRKVCILLSLGEMFCIVQLGLFGPECYSCLLFPYRSSVWLFYSLLEVEYASFLHYYVAISVFSSASVCFIYLEALILYISVTHMYIIYVIYIQLYYDFLCLF